MPKALIDGQWRDLGESRMIPTTPTPPVRPGVAGKIAEAEEELRQAAIKYGEGLPSQDPESALRLMAALKIAAEAYCTAVKGK